MQVAKAAKSEYEGNLVQNFAMNHDPRIFQCIKQFTKSHTLPPQLHFDSNVAYTDHNKSELVQPIFSLSLLGVTLKSQILMNFAYQITPLS